MGSVQPICRRRIVIIRSFVPIVLLAIQILVMPAGTVGKSSADETLTTDACASRSSLIPTIEDTLRLAEWHYLGPFSVGPREGITGIDDDPAKLIPPGQSAPSRRAAYPSMLAQGGFAEWKTMPPDSSGWVALKFDNVLWDTLAGIYGAAGVLNVTYAYAEFTRSREERALVVAERIGSFHLNGIQCLGDPYGNNFVRSPVVLKKGLNRVLLKLSGYGDPGFKFEMIPAPAPLIFLDDYTLPDLIRGDEGRFWAGVTILNTTSVRINRAVITIGDGEKVRISERIIHNLMPLCVRKVPIEIEVAAAVDGDNLVIPIEITCDGGSFDGESFRDSLNLRVRQPDQSAKRTFISRIDCSCQYYAVLPPTDYDPGKQYALIFSLHGAGVRAEGQADAYKPKSWAFIVAPTNRRPFGFDWQDWGRLDALEVLDIVKATYPIDPDRVYLTGHSMGGHGVWHVGLSHPDKFAAIAPGAGWTSFELYIPWFLQKSSIFAEPGQIGARNMSLREDQTLNFVENACNLPVFIFQGGVDDNVPPLHARMFVNRLDDLGYEYKYKEIPGRSHWWSIDSLGTSCVDDPDLINYVQGLQRDRCPSHIVFKTTDLGKSNRAYWVEITGQEKPFRDSRIEVRVIGDSSGADTACHTVDIRTKNVSGLEIFPCGHMLSANRMRLRIDGCEWMVDPGSDSGIAFSKRAGRFRPGEARCDGLHKSPESYGPIKQAYFSPFVLVYGTAGDSATTEILLRQARLEATQWWMRGNGFVEILPDSEVTDEVTADYNLIIFGGPTENRVTSLIDGHLPIRLVGEHILLGNRRMGGGAIAAKFVYPNPLNRRKLVVVHEGVGIEGLKLSTFFGTISSAAGLPDFMVLDASVKKTGWGGIKAAGFFDSAWHVNRNLLFQ